MTVGEFIGKDERLSSWEWYTKNKNDLINLFCDFIRETGRGNVTLTDFAQEMYKETTHYDEEE